MPYDMLWSWVTIALSAIIAIGYCVIAINWYFQTKVARKAEAKAALARLRGICICCGVCGIVYYTTEVPWLVWRFYDVVLAAFCLRTWSFIYKMRGWGHVDERLAQIDELERSTIKYREIAELLPHMVWTATADGAVDFSNQKWRSFVGDDRTWLDAVHAEEREHIAARWSRAVAQREPVKFEVRLGGAGGFRSFLVNATLIKQGDVTKWLGACADIEDQKLLAAQKELQAKQKSFFLNALSHDLRAPLHNLLLNAHLLKLSAKEHSEAVESIDMIMENAVAAGDMVNKLLDFAKVGAQDHNITENVSLTALINHSARRFLPIAEQKGLFLRVIDSPDVSILGDRQKLERIMTNLIDNAIKYTTVGGVTIALIDRGGEAAIRICDTGIGVPEANVPFLFDEFYQVNNYERDRNKGFGMGLAICRCLAHQIGADVRLASSNPQGSCFEIVLKEIGVDRGGRAERAQGDREDSADARVCSV